ncbi:uncharacterized protein LOC125842801 [Solanum stenotomum]|uniref:uncharacterized protein LOC125842801 n=1 Tax=Solanum stenotomum TaxID=172797 RepID=UPI0020D1AACA|nr:uncharacterized protein LOC125842801 [Solanum stenotomum]
MDFITSLPRTARRFDPILVIMDRLIKFVHFLPVRIIYSAEDYARLYIQEINLELEVEDWVFLKVSPMKGIMRFGKKVKLNPRYVGSYKIIRKFGMVAYELDFLSELEAVLPIFPVFMMRKCIRDPSCITPTENICIAEDLSYAEVPIAILNWQERKLRNKDVASGKVLWRNNNVEEMTWEVEEEMRKEYPQLFTA